MSLSGRYVRMMASRSRLPLAVTTACLIVLFAAMSVQADEPQREFSFTGRATINGEAAPLGTTIEIEVNGKIIGQGQVSGNDGKWIVQIDADLLQEGICEAVFYVNGQPADRQWNRCAVDIRLEVDPEVADDPVNQDDPEKQDDPEDRDDSEDQDDPEEQDDPDDSDDPDHPEELDNPPDESTPDDADDSARMVQPRSPGTGTGGLASEERQTDWGVAAFVVVGLAALVLSAVVMVSRRSVWSRR